MESVIQNHYTNLLKYTTAPTVKECSCQQKPNCPLAEKWLSECLLYHAQAEMSDVIQIKNYYGTCQKNLQRVLQQANSFFWK